MLEIKRLVREIHRRSLWQVLSIYLAGSWVAVQVVDTLVDNAGLPAWMPGMAIALLVIGFPVVMATAFIQEGVRHGEVDPDSASDSATGPVAGPADASGGSALPGGAPSGLGLFTWRNALLGGVGAFALLGVVATVFVVTRGAPTETGTAASAARARGERPVVAVLPFTSGGTEAESRTLSLGLHDDLLTRLSKIQSLRVISRTSMMQYQETTKDIRSIGEELGAAAILEGSVLTVGDQVSVNAQLIDAVTDEHLWAENYQRAYTVQNLFDLQREIAEQITGALSATLLPEERSELAAVPTEDLDAYNFFLRGNTYFNNGPRSEDFEVAFQMYERSVEIDPDFAEAWAKLSLAHSQRCQNYNSCSRPAVRTATLDAASKALSLAPSLPEALVAMGYYHYSIEKDYPRALEYAQRAAESGYDDPEVHHLLGAVVRRMDDFTGSFDSWSKAVELDPLSGHFLEDLGSTATYSRRFDEAESALVRAIELAPTESAPYSRLSELFIKLDGMDTQRARNAVLEYPNLDDGEMDSDLWWLDLVDRDFEAALTSPYGQRNPYRRALVLDLAGRVDEARAVWDSVTVGTGNFLSENPEAWGARLSLARAYAGLSRNEEAVAQTDTALAAVPFEVDAVSAVGAHYRAATIFARVGDAGRTAEMMELLLDRSTGTTPAELRADPEFDAIRTDPRIRDLIGS
jgi:TolB-like protein/Tfp pilus assembly protein PilF